MFFCTITPHSQARQYYVTSVARLPLPSTAAHDAIQKWMAANQRQSAGQSWEIYGDPTPDPADIETTVVYLRK